VAISLSFVLNPKHGGPKYRTQYWCHLYTIQSMSYAGVLHNTGVFVYDYVVNNVYLRYCKKN